jgi:hypothetical protein
MHEMKRGQLRSGRSGKKVTSREQAIAIGLSEARASGAQVPDRPSGERPRHRSGNGIVVALFVSVACFGSSAHASTEIAADLDFSGVFDEPVSSGYGGALRAGYGLNLLLLKLTPEFGASFHRFTGEPGVSLVRAFVGGRLALGSGLEPGVYAHLGIGHLSGNSALNRTTPAFDAGLFLDLTILPLINLGVHGSYNALLHGEQPNAFDFYLIGAHAALVL